MNVISCFDGLGGAYLALERAGIKVDKYYAFEIDKYAKTVSSANYPDIIHLGDIRDFESLEIDDEIDLVIGGSPCQSFSSASEDRKGFDGKSGLFWLYKEVLDFYQPKYFMLENVKMKKEWQDIISEAVGVQPILIDSALVCAQSRKRNFWTNIPGVTQPEDKGVTIKDIILPPEEVADNFYLSDVAETRIFNSARSHQLADINTPKTRTLIAQYHRIPSDGMYYNDGGFNRRYTPLECERLMTIPDNYTNHVSNTQRYQMIGNSWVIDVVAHILKNIR